MHDGLKQLQGLSNGLVPCGVQRHQTAGSSDGFCVHWFLYVSIILFLSSIVHTLESVPIRNLASLLPLQFQCISGQIEIAIIMTVYHYK